MDVVFVPDSELMLPGRGGAADPLSVVRAAAISELTDVLHRVDIRSVLVLYCASGPFNTPLPGKEVAEGLLAATGFTGDVVFQDCRWGLDASTSFPSSEIACDIAHNDQEHSAVILLGTGSAAREADAPILHRPEALELDDAIQQALQNGASGKFPAMVTDLPREVGATLVPTMVKLDSLGVSKVRVRKALTFDALGVRYFVGSWRCDVVAQW